MVNSCCKLDQEESYHDLSIYLFVRTKMTDFAAAFLKFCDDICGISYCYAVKIYHGQHSSNIVMPFLTSRTISRAPE